MGLDMDFYKLPKGTKVYSFIETYDFNNFKRIGNRKEITDYDSFVYFRKNYTIHQIMGLSLMLSKMNAKKITDFKYLPFSYLCGSDDYKISKKQYEWIIKLAKSRKLKNYIRGYDNTDNPKQLLEILKDFDDYDFYYSWVS